MVHDLARDPTESFGNAKTIRSLKSAPRAVPRRFLWAAAAQMASRLSHGLATFSTVSLMHGLFPARLENRLPLAKATLSACREADTSHARKRPSTIFQSLPLTFQLALTARAC